MAVLQELYCPAGIFGLEGCQYLTMIVHDLVLVIRSLAVSHRDPLLYRMVPDGGEYATSSFSVIRDLHPFRRAETPARHEGLGYLLGAVQTEVNSRVFEVGCTG